MGGALNEFGVIPAARGDMHELKSTSQKQSDSNARRGSDPSDLNLGRENSVREYIMSDKKARNRYEKTF